MMDIRRAMGLGSLMEQAESLRRQVTIRTSDGDSPGWKGYLEARVRRDRRKRAIRNAALKTGGKARRR